MEKYLAVDLGGTKLLVGESDRYGQISNVTSRPTGPLDQRAAAELIVGAVDEALAKMDVKPAAIGVGVVGRVDPRTGVWLQIDHTRNESTPLGQMLTDRFAIPAFIDNDVKSAAQAVGRFELTDCRDYIYINAGTGLAAACVVDGRLVRGGHFNAGEVGHTRVGVNVGVTCGCGRSECVELIAAGVGFDRCARLLAPRFDTALELPDEPQRVDVRRIYELAREGDGLCVELVENAASALASLVMNLVRVTDPEAVVLGGGIVADGYFYNKVLERLNPNTVRFVTRGVTLTALDAAMIGLKGAAAVAINNVEKLNQQK